MSVCTQCHLHTGVDGARCLLCQAASPPKWAPLRLLTCLRSLVYHPTIVFRSVPELYR